MISGSTLPQWQKIKSHYPDGKINLKDCAKILEPLYRAIMGSPDPYGRQLNGMGGGLSSLSKAVIVDKSMSKDYDLDYLFIQIGIKDGKLDLAGNCGNMTSAVGPFGLEEQLVSPRPQGSTTRTAEDTETSSSASPQDVFKVGPLKVRLRNLNTSRIIEADIYASENTDAKSGAKSISFEAQGDYVLDGVSGYSSPITLSFISPGGAKTGKALPTGNATDHVEYTPGQSIRASLLDISNPGVFIDGRDVAWNPASTPEQLNADTDLMTKLEAIRRAGAAMMGMDLETPSIPKIVLLFPPASENVDITCQALSMEQAHKAVPMTLGLNLGVACKIPGTIAHLLARQNDPVTTVVGHPSGRVEVGADISSDGEIISAKVIRTARC